MTAPVVFGEAELYSLAGVDCEFCLATHKPGVCVGTGRGGTTVAPPAQRPHVPVPAAPQAKSTQQIAADQQKDAAYRAAYQAAQGEAQALGADHRHAAVQGAMNDYARAASAHGRAVAVDNAARARLQAVHDAAVKRNQAVDASNAAAAQAATARAAAQTAHAALVARRKALHQAARAHQRHRPHHSIEVDESSLYGLAELELYSTLSGAHWWCAVNEFCRNPLHPGPCKGWKHMLHSIAPGAYHAYEQQRVKKLNEKRKAKIAELEAAGKKIPSYLKKEIIYQQQPKAPEGVQFHAPTPKEAISKLPTTAKEIGAKIAMKHEAIAQAKAEHLKANQKAAVLALMQAHQGQLTPGAEKSASAFVDQAQAKLKPGEKLSDVPQIHNTLDIIAQKQGDAAGLDAQQKAELLADLKQHVDEGIPELPILLTSAKNAAKAKQDAEQAKAEAAKQAEQAKKDAEELAAKKAAQGDALHKIAVAVQATNDAPEAKQAFHNAIGVAHEKLPESGKVSEAPGMHGLLNHLAQKGNGQLTELHDKLGKTGPGISKVSQEIADHVDQGKPGLPPSLAKIADLKKQVEEKASISAHPYTPAQVMAATTPAYHSGNPYTHPHLTSPLTKAEFDDLDAQHQEKVIGSLDTIIKKHPATEASGHAKGLKHTYLPNTPQPAATGADELAGQAKAAPPGSSLAPHVQEAHDLASGAKYGTAKTKLAAYGALTADEYHSLPIATQTQIHIDLVTAHSKFLDPKKKQQVMGLLDKIGLPKESPHGAGAPHEQPVEEPHHVKMAAAHMAVQELAGVSHGPAAQAQVEAATKESYQTHHSMNDVQYAAGALSTKWSQKHLDDLPLPSQDKGEIEAKAKAEIQQMIIKGQTDPPSGGVLYVGAHMPVPAPSPQAKAELFKYAAGVDEGVKPGAGGHLKDEAMQILGAPSTSFTGKASQLSKEHFDALPESTQNVVLDKLKDIEADAGPEMSAKATALIEKFTGKAGAAVAAPAVEPKKIASKAGLGKGKLIKNFTAGAKAQVVDAYKSQGSAAYLDAPVEQNLQAVLNTAHALHGAKGVGSLSLNQTIDVIDDQMASKTGKPNANLLRKKIEEFLATAEGAKFAKAMKPNAGKVEELKPLQPLKAGEIVPDMGGPGGYDQALTEDDFIARTHSEMGKIQQQYMTTTGKSWSSAEISAIKYYTGSGYQSLNTYLRTGKGGTPTVKAHVKNLQTAMMPLQKHSLLVRGTGWSQLPHGYRDPESVKKLIGKTIDDPAFISTATAGTGSGFGGAVKLSIEAPKGTMGAYVAPVSSVGEHEYEYLLAAGTKLKVTGVETIGGVTYVKVRVVSK